MQLQKLNTFPVLISVGGALVFSMTAEGLHVDKAQRPHIPHQVYVFASTSDLFYTISFTTAPGSVLTA